ncbi:clindamycin resistance transfer factor btgA, partial [Bacteroides xylanisolvens]
ALDRAEKAVGQSRDMLLKNQQAIYARLDAVTQRQEKIFSYIASYIDAKGKAGLFDDIKALYKNEKNKREKI